jgi:hypothetical protein
VNATFTVNSVSAYLRPLRRPGAKPFLALSLSFVGVVFGSVALQNSSKCKGFWLALGLVLLIGLLAVGCGGTKSSTPSSSASTGSTSAPAAGGSAPQTFMVTVTGNSGSIQQSATVTVTVN